MFSTPEISVHVLYKNREISPLEREEGYGGKDLEKRWVLRREWKTLWDTPTTDLGAESELGDEREHSEVADWPGTRGDGGSLFHRWGAAYRKERLMILRLDWAITLICCILKRTPFLSTVWWLVMRRPTRIRSAVTHLIQTQSTILVKRNNYGNLHSRPTLIHLFNLFVKQMALDILRHSSSTSG